MKNLAEKYHKGQFRKGEGNVPYIVHPQAVAETLTGWGENPAADCVKTAWGHDLLEDTAVSESEILAVSNEHVLNCIKMLTKPDGVKKSNYLQGVADSGIRDVLLVKIADRICNSRDFVKLKNALYALQYMHEADALIPALEKISGDSVVQNALAAWRELDKTLFAAARRRAIRGSLLGGAVGDALGSPVEFLNKKSICKLYGSDGVTDYVEFNDGTGSITDDTQMTLFTAEGILRACVRDNERGICGVSGVVKCAYLRWLKTQGVDIDKIGKYLDGGWLINEKQLFQWRAPGNTCLSALEHPELNTLRARNNSKGCGTVMRMAPAGLFYDPATAYELGCDFPAITHGHPTGITAGGAFAMLIAFLLHGKNLENSLDLLEKHLQQIPEAAETLAAVQKARRAGSIEELGEGWVAEEALAIGIYCALKHTWDFRAGVLEAVNIDGDSDSTGAIAGNLLGVLNGEDAIPEKWRKNLREYAIVSQIADDLCVQFEANPDGHVSENWWNKYPGY